MGSNNTRSKIRALLSDLAPASPTELSPTAFRTTAYGFAMLIVAIYFLVVAMILSGSWLGTWFFLGSFAALVVGAWNVDRQLRLEGEVIRRESARLPKMN